MRKPLSMLPGSSINSHTVIALALLASLGCGDDGGGTGDAGVAADAGVVADAGAPADAGQGISTLDVAGPDGLTVTLEDCAGPRVFCVGVDRDYSVIQDAVDQADQPGDLLQVFTGTYAGFAVDNVAGTSASPIVIRAVEQPVLINAIRPNPDRGTSSGSRRDEGIQLYQSDYVTVEGFTVDMSAVASDAEGIASHGAYAWEPHQGLVVRHNKVITSNGVNIYLSNSQSSTIEYNIVAESAHSHGIYLTNGGSDDCTIRGNIAYDNAASGIHMNGDCQPDDIDPGPLCMHSNVLIENNILYGNGFDNADGSGMDLDGAEDFVIRNNVIFGNYRHGVRIHNVDSAYGGMNIAFYNNTLYSAARGTGLKISPDRGGHIIFNNAIYGDGDEALYFDSSTVQSDYNGFAASATFSLTYGGAGEVLSVSQWTAMFDAHAVTADAAAVLANPGSGTAMSADDLRLGADSAATGAGTAGLSGESTTPYGIDGSLRNAAAPSIGAFAAP